MRAMLTIAGFTATAVLFVPVSVADHRDGHPKPKANPQLTIAASPNPVLWAKSTTISGRLRGSDNAGKTVDLEENPWPFPGPFKSVATTTTASDGTYSFSVKPGLHTNYRAVAKIAPPETSNEVAVQVRMRINRRVSTRRPERGERVIFRGAVAPEHDGRLVYIQRRKPDGTWRTKARARLKDAGETRPNKSVYRRGVRVFRDGVYRVRVRNHEDHLGNKTRRVRLNVP
jgi:hypothetical protein